MEGRERERESACEKESLNLGERKRKSDREGGSRILPACTREREQRARELRMLPIPHQMRGRIIPGLDAGGGLQFGRYARVLSVSGYQG